MDDRRYTDVSVPTREPFVLVGWADGIGDYPQTCSIFYDTTNLTDGSFPTDGLNRFQRRIMAMRLRYVADLVDPDIVSDD